MIIAKEHKTELKPGKELFYMRVLLILAVIYTVGFPLFPKMNHVRTEAVPITENGVGGGFSSDHILFNPGILDEDLELMGVPEPEEYTRPRILVFDSYRIEKGDTISAIAVRTGLNEDTLLSVNGIKNSRLLQIGQILKIPNQDGIYCSVGKNDTLLSISEKYSASTEGIKIVNEMFSDSLALNAALFIPGARMDWIDRQEINGDLFIWPVPGYITSSYGYREDPFGRGRQFHSGLDIGAAAGTPVRAAMAGRVSTTGYDDSFGNYIIISHHSGYRTLYAHLSAITIKSGAYVGTGERIGLVGSTGLSTAPHLHFTVYKNGVTVNPRSLMN